MNSFTTYPKSHFRSVLQFLFIVLLFMGAQARPLNAAVWYVTPGGSGSGSGWADALGSVQGAINSAAGADEIWVASGTYNESISLVEGVSLYGGFSATETLRSQRDWVANPTIIDASGLGTRVVTVIGVEGTTLDGLTIRGGTAIGNSPNSWGGGIYYSSVTSATLTNCTITGNSATDAGGGVSYSSSDPTLTNCTITGNSATYAGGGVYCRYSNPTLTNCTITDNLAGGAWSFSGSGGGVYCYRSNPTLTNCTITGNSAGDEGGGVFGYPTLINCTITGNWATHRGGGVVSYYNAVATLTNCTITGNAALDEGGGVYCYYAYIKLTNCTIAGNSASRGGGVYCAHYASPTLTNCILWNPGSEVNGSALVDYSCVQGGFGGAGNITDDPRFIDAANGDYRLLPDSPCIDAGNPDVAYNDGCLPPGQGTERNDMGFTGGPGNCGETNPAPEPTPTATEPPIITATATPFPTATETPPPTVTETPTRTALPMSSPTPVITTGYDLWPEGAPDGKVDTRDLIILLEQLHEEGPDSLLEFSKYWYQALIDGAAGN